MNAPIVLTDAPAVVQLKRLFRELDEQEEDLKLSLRLARTLRETSSVLHDLEGVRGKKQKIARQIFEAEDGARGATRPT